VREGGYICREKERAGVKRERGRERQSEDPFYAVSNSLPIDYAWYIL
jgi:hypothetical protein